jgi:hypothetical protein
MVLCLWGYLDSWGENISRSDSPAESAATFRSNWTSVSASMSASVEYEHEHIVLIDSLLDLHEHGGDTDGPTIVSNTTAQGL